MITVKGIDDAKDIRLIKQFSNYCLSRFLTPYQLRNTKVEIHYLDRDEVDPADKKDLSKYEAWMCPATDSNKHYFITIAKFAINKNAKTRLAKYKKTLKYLAHELVHVKQYRLGEMRDLYDGDGENIIGTCWMHKDYPAPSSRLHAVNPTKAEWAYYDSPWEVEAYGRTDGLWNMFFDELGTPWRKIPT